MPQSIIADKPNPTGSWKEKRWQVMNDEMTLDRHGVDTEMVRSACERARTRTHTPDPGAVTHTNAQNIHSC